LPSQQQTQAIIAVAELSFLEQEYDIFKLTAADYIKSFEGVVQLYLNDPAKVGMMAGSPYYDAAQKMTGMIQRDFHERMDLEGHPSFDLDPYNHVVNDEKLSNEDDKLRYRRVYDQFQTAKRNISYYESLYLGSIAARKQEITQIGATSFSGQTGP
jgi:hypothetical protein